jgi:DNA repair protein RecO (recombination protein O)
MPVQNVDRHRQHAFRLEALVLRHIDWGEADRLIWLYTPEMGKLHAVAKGVRKPRSRKAGHLEPFTRANLLLAHGRDLPLITQAETLDAFLPLRDDLRRTTYAAYMVELLDRFTYEGSDSPHGESHNLYRLIIETLSRLCQPLDPDLVSRYYEVRLLDLVGFRPQLFHCAVCEREIQAEDQYFSAQQGGVLCPNCGARFSGSRPISMKALKYLRHFQRSNFTQAARVELTPALNREIELMMQHYLTYLLERGLNTPPFLKLVRNTGNMGEGEPSNEATN